MVYSPCFEQSLNNGLACGTPCQSNLQRGLTIAILARQLFAWLYA